MSTKKVKPEKFTDAMADLLAKYGDGVYELVEDSAKDIARKATSELRQKSPGQYARMWRHKAQKNGKTQYKETIYNMKYQLTHLLEKPHATGRGTGHYPKHSGGKTDHTGIIASVEEKYVNEFLNELENKL